LARWVLAFETDEHDEPPALSTNLPPGQAPQRMRQLRSLQKISLRIAKIRRAQMIDQASGFKQSTTPVDFTDLVAGQELRPQ
jgi:hypothetical protein